MTAGAAERPATEEKELHALGHPTQTIYARVPTRLKQEVDAYAAAAGQTLAGAVSELVSRGLAAGPPSGQAVSFTSLEMDLAMVLTRIAQAHRARVPLDHRVWERIITVDLPCIASHLSPELRHLVLAHLPGEAGCGLQCPEVVSTHPYLGTLAIQG